MNDLISRQAAIDAVEFGITYAKAVNKETGEITELFKNSNKELRNAVKRIEALPSVQPEIIRCKDCKHKPRPSDNYDHGKRDCGFEIIFPGYRCPCRCEDEFYNHIPDDDWFCGNAERR